MELEGGLATINFLAGSDDTATAARAVELAGSKKDTENPGRDSEDSEDSEIFILSTATCRLSEPPDVECNINHESLKYAIRDSMELYQSDHQVRRAFLAHFTDASCEKATPVPDFEELWAWGRDEFRTDPGNTTALVVGYPEIGLLILKLFVTGGLIDAYLGKPALFESETREYRDWKILENVVRREKCIDRWRKEIVESIRNTNATREQPNHLRPLFVWVDALEHSNSKLCEIMTQSYGNEWIEEDPAGLFWDIEWEIPFKARRIQQPTNAVQRIIEVARYCTQFVATLEKVVRECYGLLPVTAEVGNLRQKQHWPNLGEAREKKLDYVEALDTYAAQSDTEHSIVKGEKLVLIKEDSANGRVEVERGGTIGSVPMKYVQIFKSLGGRRAEHMPSKRGRPRRSSTVPSDETGSDYDSDTLESIHRGSAERSLSRRDLRARAASRSREDSSDGSGGSDQALLRNRKEAKVFSPFVLTDAGPANEIGLRRRDTKRIHHSEEILPPADEEGLAEDLAGSEPRESIHLRDCSSQHPESIKSTASKKKAPVVRGKLQKVVDFCVKKSTWRFIGILLLIASVAATTVSLNSTRPPSSNSPIYQWSHKDDGFWSSLAQMLVSVFSSLCMVLPILRRGRDSLNISLPLFLLSLLVSAVSGIAGIALYDWGWRYSTGLGCTSIIIQGYATLALIEGIDKELD